MDDDFEVDVYVDDERDVESTTARRRSSRSALAAEADKFLKHHSSDTAELPNEHSKTQDRKRTDAAALRAADSPTSKRLSDQESIQRDREKLQKFASEAASWLDAVYEDGSEIIVEDDVDSRSGAGMMEGARRKSTEEDFRKKQRIELDKAKLERFSKEAEALLDMAYSDDASGFVVEESLSPTPSSGALVDSSTDGVVSPAASPRNPDRATSSKRLGRRLSANVDEDKRMLREFHNQAMSFLDAAAPSDEPSPGTVRGHQMSPSRARRTGIANRTSAAVRRDKDRLEQHYREAMAFLDRAEKGEDIIEERELESGALQRVRLKAYAREAMTVLEKAVTQDPFAEDSIAIDDDEEDPILRQESSGAIGRNGNHGKQAAKARSREAAIEALVERAAGAQGQPVAHSPPTADESQTETDGTGTEVDEDQQIAEDRAAMERYYDEDNFGESQVIEESLSDTSGGTDRGLFARRVGGQSDTGDEWEDEDVSTDNEFQADDPTLSSNVERTRVLDESLVGAGLPAQMRSAAAPRRALGKTANDGNTADTSAAVGNDDSRVAGGSRAPPGHRAGSSRSAEDDASDGAQGLDTRAKHSGASSPNAAPADSAQNPRLPSAADARPPELPPEFPIEPPALDEAYDGPPLRPPESSTTTGDRDVLFELLLQGKNTADSGNEWAEVPLERSFYRQVPRGATIKLRSRTVEPEPDAVPNIKAPEVTPPNGFSSPGAHDLRMQRLSTERDTVIAALEEVVNERSQMAAQISEMKAMIKSAVGQQTTRSLSSEGGEIDIAAELRDAYNEIHAIIRESEATVSVLEGYIADGKRRIAELELEQEDLKKQLERARGSSIDSRELTAEIQALKRELDRAHDENRRLKESEASIADMGSGSGSGHLWMQLNNARAEIEEAVQARERAEKRLAEATAGGSGLMDSRHVAPEEVRKQVDDAVARAEQNRNAEVEDLKKELDRVSEAHQRERTDSRNDVLQARMEAQQKSAKVESLEGQLLILEQELVTHRTSSVENGAEVKKLRAQLEAREAFDASQAGSDHAKEVLGLQAELRGVQDELRFTTGKLSQQLAAALDRATQAEERTASVEQALRDAEINAAKAIDGERRARKMAEAREAAADQIESKSSRDVADRSGSDKGRDERKDKESAGKRSKSAAGRDAGDGLAPSSSKRGLRKSPSKQVVEKKKKSSRSSPDGSQSSADEASDKKKSHRLRLFG